MVLHSHKLFQIKESYFVAEIAAGDGQLLKTLVVRFYQLLQQKSLVLNVNVG